MEKSFIKASVYQQTLDSRGVGEQETKIENAPRPEETRPEWKLLKDSNFKSLHDQLKDDESLKEGLFRAQALERNTAADEDAPLYYGSDLVDCPENRREESIEVEAFRSERQQLITQPEAVSTSSKAEMETNKKTSDAGRRLRFFGRDEARKLRRVEPVVEGYESDDDDPLSFDS